MDKGCDNCSAKWDKLYGTIRVEMGKGRLVIRCPFCHTPYYCIVDDKGRIKPTQLITDDDY